MPDWLLAIATHPATLVAVGGAVGANARFWGGRLAAAVQPAWVEFPLATFAINVAGSLLLGVFAALYRGHPDPARQAVYLLLGTGFCGGFTTFSTFSVETLELLRADRPAAAAAYVGGSVALGLAGAWLGLRLFGK